jgi:hypothetical protein
MNTATLELSEGDWVRIILALHSKAESTDFDPAYCKQLATLADEIEELVAVQVR